MLFVYVRIAARSLWQGGRRSGLMGLAIGLVTLLFVLLVGLTTGLESSVVRTATTLMSGHVNIGGFYKLTRGRAMPVVTRVRELRALLDKEAESLGHAVDYVIDRERGWARVISERSTFQSGIIGMDIQEERGLFSVLELSEQSRARGSRLEALAEPGTVLLFEGQAERLEVGVGDTVTLSAPTFRGVNNTVDLRVVAIARDVGFMSAWNVFVPKGTVRALYQVRLDSTGVIHIYLEDPEAASDYMARLRTTLEGAGFQLLDHRAAPFYAKFDSVAGQDWTGQRLDLSVWQDEVSFLTWILTGFRSVRWTLVVVLTIIIVVGVMNTLWMAIRERTREIGTLRAIGMPRGRVVQMFLFEALLLGAAATSLGGLTGVGLAWALNAANVHIPIEAFQIALMSDRLYLEIVAGDVLSTVVSITLITGLAALYPAWCAARLKPINAIHHVG